MTTFQWAIKIMFIFLLCPSQHLIGQIYSYRQYQSNKSIKYCLKVGLGKVMGNQMKNRLSLPTLFLEVVQKYLRGIFIALANR